MSNDENVWLGLFLMELNQLITEFEFFHWLTLSFSLRRLLMLSKMTLLTLPSSLFDGLIRRHLGLDSKLSLWSLFLWRHFDQNCPCGLCFYGGTS